MDIELVRVRIRALIDTGDLPCEDPDQTWAGQGEGKRCSGCWEPITPAAVEYEVELPSGRTVFFHRACHDIWLEECEAAKPSP
jgi:hypothetical protein